MMMATSSRILLCALALFRTTPATSISKPRFHNDSTSLVSSYPSGMVYSDHPLWLNTTSSNLSTTSPTSHLSFASPIAATTTINIIPSSASATACVPSLYLQVRAPGTKYNRSIAVTVSSSVFPGEYLSFRDASLLPNGAGTLFSIESTTGHLFAKVFKLDSSQVDEPAIFYTSDAGDEIVFLLQGLNNRDAAFLECSVMDPDRFLQCNGQDTFAICDAYNNVLNITDPNPVVFAPTDADNGCGFIQLQAINSLCPTPISTTTPDPTSTAASSCIPSATFSLVISDPTLSSRYNGHTIGLVDSRNYDGSYAYRSGDATLFHIEPATYHLLGPDTSLSPAAIYHGVYAEEIIFSSRQNPLSTPAQSFLKCKGLESEGYLECNGQEKFYACVEGPLILDDESPDYQPLLLSPVGADTDSGSCVQVLLRVEYVQCVV